MALMTEKLRAIMALDPDRTEIDFEGHDYSWRQIAETVRAIENALETMGLPADTRVGVMLRNRPGHVAAIVAVLSTDRCLVTLNPILPDAKLFEDIEGLGLPVVIADATDLARPGVGPSRCSPPDPANDSTRPGARCASALPTSPSSSNPGGPHDPRPDS